MNAANVRPLPPGFEALEEFTPGWGEPSTNARHHHRQTSAMVDIQRFHASFRPRFDDVFSYLDAYDVWALPPDAQNLLNLAFGYIEAALAVEIFKVPGVPGIPYPDGFFSVRRELR